MRSSEVPQGPQGSGRLTAPAAPKLTLRGSLRQADGSGGAAADARQADGSGGAAAKPPMLRLGGSGFAAGFNPFAGIPTSGPMV